MRNRKRGEVSPLLNFTPSVKSQPASEILRILFVKLHFWRIEF